MEEILSVIIDTNSSINRKYEALEALEDLVHNIYNALDLHNINGLVPLIQLLNSKDDGLKLRAAWVLGIATQNNPKVQQQVFTNSGLKILIQELQNSSQTNDVLVKLLFALSAFIRQNTSIQDEFFFTKQEGQIASLTGLDLLSRIYVQRSYERIQMKVLSILFSVLSEHHSNHSLLLSELARKGWCLKISSVLYREDYSEQIIEKTIETMNFMAVNCVNIFGDFKLQRAIAHLKEKWKRMGIEGTLDEDYVNELLESINHLEESILYYLL